jgi:hypothetical protein
MELQSSPNIIILIQQIVKQPDANASLSCKTTGEICRIRNTIDSLESVWLTIENMLDAYKYCAKSVL